MEKLFSVIFLYLLGAALIQWFCVSILAHIPLIDSHAYTIRNVLCFLFLIVLIIAFVFL